MKTCTKCGVEKPLEEFYARPKSKDGRRAECKKCKHAENRSWQTANLDRYREYGRSWRLLNKYGLDEESFEALLLAQGNSCAICGSDSPGGNGGWHIDHDHTCCLGVKSCGKCVRGLLCFGCNVGLGHFKDNKDRLRNAITYLEGRSI